MLKQFVKHLISLMGYKIISVRNDNSESFAMFAALKRCLERGIQVNSIVDVGASDGRWTADCMKLIPDGQYLLIEAQNEHRKALEEFGQKHQNVTCKIAAAGPHTGKIYFDAKDLFGGVASISPIEGGFQVPMVSIDDQVKEQNLCKPFLLKLDTHGFEIPILEGAREVLNEAELVIIEAYNYRITQDSLKFFELCDYMDKLGFATIEIADPMLRLYDHSFWQMDLFFIRKTRSEFSYNAYR